MIDFVCHIPKTEDLQSDIIDPDNNIYDGEQREGYGVYGGKQDV